MSYREKNESGLLQIEFSKKSLKSDDYKQAHSTISQKAGTISSENKILLLSSNFNVIIDILEPYKMSLKKMNVKNDIKNLRGRSETDNTNKASETTDFYKVIALG